MGYTHYWYRRKEIPKEDFLRIVGLFKKVYPVLSEMGVVLKGPDGTGDPIITDEEVYFNGDANCGHAERELCIAWPATKARGIEEEGALDGTWFGGRLVTARTCDGDCSHESFCFPRIEHDYHKSDRHPGWYTNFCKTAFKPYDLAVITFLAIAKLVLGPDLMLSSDGKEHQWADAFDIIYKVIGFRITYWQIMTNA